MFCFLCSKTIFLHGRQTITATIFRLSSTSLRFTSTTSTSTSGSNQQSFTVSYLINKCGFSPETASLVSMHVHFKTPEKPDSVISFLENHSFSKTQIKNFISRTPNLLLADAEKTLLPKLEFLHSIGFPRSELTEFLSHYPSILRYSLEQQIIPSCNFLRSLFKSDAKTIKAIKRFTGVLTNNLEIHLFPNIEILRRNGVPESNIAKIFYRMPRTLMFNPVRLEEIVGEVKRTGIPPSKMKFLEAIFALKSMRKSTLENKFVVYRRWGWSDQDIIEAFSQHPTFITISEEKIMAIMDFLVNKMGYSSALIAKQPSILKGSLEKKIVPRALFVQELSSRGLSTGFTLSSVFDASEVVFRKLFVYRHAEKAPELLKLYIEKLNSSGKMRVSE